jgi:RimJ/RimL family protein N-acetyltransferase
MLKGKNVTLRGFELSDIDEIMKHWNDLELRQFLAHINPDSKEDEIEWIKSTWKLRSEKKEYVFAIELNSKKQLIGSTALHKIDWINRSAEFGIAIYRKFWSKGYGTEAIKLILDYAFNWLNLNHISLRVKSFNDRAIKTYKKVGFKEIGKFRQSTFRNGKYHDDIIMDILASEFK